MVESNFTKSFIVGAISGAIPAIMFQPLDVMKTRLQITSNAKLTTTSAQSTYLVVIKSIYRTDGVIGFWKGLTPTLLRCVPGVGLYFSTLHLLNVYVISDETSIIQTTCAASFARALGAVCFNPLTILKTRFESGEYNYTGIYAAMKHIQEKEGIRGFARGITPTIIRDVPFSGLYYMFYTRIKIFWGVNHNEKNSPIKVFSSGIIAGCIASIITHPADMIKTYMQMYPNEFSRITYGLQFIHRQFGIKGYLRGVTMRLLRRTLVTAMSWTVYEEVSTYLGDVCLVPIQINETYSCERSKRKTYQELPLNLPLHVVDWK